MITFLGKESTVRRNHRSVFRVIAAGMLLTILGAASENGCRNTNHLIGSAVCLKCHDGRSAPDKREFMQGPHKNLACEECHGPGYLHFNVGGRMGLFIENPAKSPYAEAIDLCAQCHPDMVNGYTGTPHFEKKKASCNTCHDIHKTGAMIFSTENRKFLNAEEYGQLCGFCHRATVNSFSNSEHALKQILTCGACHTMHAETNLVASPLDNTLCLQCHASFELGFDSDEAVSAHIGPFHAINPEGTGAGRCTGCHMQPLAFKGQPNVSHNHTLIPRPPEQSNQDIAENITVRPNSCSGILGCHDPAVPDSGGPFDLNNVEDNTLLQSFYDSVGGMP